MIEDVERFLPPRVLRQLTPVEALGLAAAFGQAQAATAQLVAIWNDLGLAEHDVNGTYRIENGALIEVTG